MKIGVLALQGDFAEHIAILEQIGIEAYQVRLPDHLEALDGLFLAENRLPLASSPTISIS
jgi:5'-phosphate synthase pdxT subunit